MAESTLAVTIDELREEAGHQLGWGRTEWKGDAAKEAVVEAVVKAAQRLFYYNASVDGSAPHQWWFLRPTVTISITSGTDQYDLADNLGGIEGPLTIQSSTRRYMPVRLTSEANIRQMRSQHSVVPSGPPTYAAVRPKLMTDPTTGQRFQVVVFPTPDAAYTLEAQGWLLPDALTDGLPYAYGGAAHAETLLQAVRAIAEQKIDDQKGIEWEHWQKRLAASIAYDKRVHGASHGPYHGDRSDAVYGGRFQRSGPTVSYEGTILP